METCQVFCTENQIAGHYLYESKLPRGSFKQNSKPEINRDCAQK